MVDLKTAVLMTGAGHLALGAVLLLSLQADRHRAMLTVWAGVQFTKGFAGLLFGLRDTIPDAWSFVAANVLALGGLTLELLVFRYFVSGHWHLRSVGALGLAAIAIYLADAALVAPHPSAGNAMLVMSVAIAVIVGLSGLTLLRAPRRSPLLYVLATANLCLAAAAAYRGYALGTSAFPLFANVMPNHLLFLGVFATMLLNGIGFLLLVKEEADAELRRLTVTDSLTGLSNRRAFTEFMERMQRGSRRTDATIGLILLDLDHFKRINDGYGHAAGDEMLTAAARTIRETMRDVDVCARLGGEEFACALPGATLDEATEAANRLRTRIEMLHLRGDPGCAVTMSAGVTVLGKDDSLRTALGRADKALYEAKRRGRNQVVATAQ